MSSGFEHADALVLGRIHVDRNAVHSGQRLREHVPATFIFREIKKICLSVRFELHFQSPLGQKKRATDFTGLSRMLHCSLDP
jgi:hypothetical protein